MAYFPNGCAGEVFDEQCSRCIFGERPCPVALVQREYNYSACNNKVARAILDELVKDDGTCTMFQMAPGVFTNDWARGQLSLFDDAPRGVDEGALESDPPA